MSLDEEIKDELMQSIKETNSMFYLTELKRKLEIGDMVMTEEKKGYYIHAINNQIMVVDYRNRKK